MRVVFLHNDFRVYWKGKLYFLRNFLAKHNIDMHVIELFGTGSPYLFDSINNKEDWWECLFETEIFSELSKKTVEKAITRRLDEVNPDLIVCGPLAFMAGAIGLRWGRSKKRKVIVFDDSKFTGYNRNALVNFIKKRLTKLADGYLVPSEDYDEEYKKWNIGIEKLSYGLNCVDNSFFSSSHKKEDFNTKKIICVARLVPIKNLKTLLRCWRSIEDLDQDYQLIIIGDGPELKPLQLLMSELMLSRVKFLGFQKRRVIARLFSLSNAFILPSLLEGWGMVVNEAMAAGLPILLSDKINAGHTLLRNNVNGYSFDPNEETTITDVILKYIKLSEPDKLKMSLAALSTIEKYDFDYLGEQLLAAINKIKTSERDNISTFDYMLMALWSGKFQTSNWDTLN